jgi:hypothetical protein
VNLAITVNEAACETPPPTPGVFNVRVTYIGPADSGHVSGPFSTKEAAEKAVIAALTRAEVQSAVIEVGA